MSPQNQILALLDKSPSVALLRARSCGLILEFLIDAFEQETALSSENIHNRLADYLNDKGVQNDDENGIQIFDTYEEKAVKFIKKWTDSGYLTNYQNDDGDIYYELSSHTSKVIDWLSGLKREEYIGTESKFKSIITQLRELVEYTNEDKEKRLQLLEDKKQEIENQIIRLKTGEDVKVFEEYEIVPRFRQITKLAKELLSDFKDVDGNFKDIIKEIYKKQIDPSLKKGDIMQFTFDALDDLKSSPQGKSFYAFWEFLLAREMQTELETMIAELFNTLKDKNIEPDDNFLKNMVQYLYESGSKVYQTNDKMADKLSRIIRENTASRSDIAKQIVQDIKNLIIDISKKDGRPNVSLSIDTDIDINIPFDRKITFEQTETVEYKLKPTSSDLNISDLNELRKIFGNVIIDKKMLEQNIRSALRDNSQITLSDVIAKFPLQQGLPELFGYFGVLNHFKHKTINESKQQPINFDLRNNKRILIPEIIISR